MMKKKIKNKKNKFLKTYLPLINFLDSKIGDDYFKAINNNEEGTLVSIQLVNLVALYKESVDNDNKNFFDLVFNAKALKQIKSSYKELKVDNVEITDENVLQEVLEELADDIQLSEEENFNAFVDELAIDDSLKHLTHTSGEYHDFKEHIPIKIRVILSFIPITKNGIAKLNDAVPFTKKLSAEEASQMLYSTHIDYTNVDTMLESIKDVSNKFPKYDCFKRLAKILEQDYKLLANFYNTFGKLNVIKTEIKHNNGNFFSDISNKYTDLRYTTSTNMKKTNIDFTTMTYAKAAARLNEILRQMEQEQLDIDTLTDTLKEAKQLISFCKNRLSEVDKSVREIMDGENE